MERVFCLLIFIAAISPAIVIEESALGVSQPVALLCVEILTCLALSAVFKINILAIELTLHLCPVFRGCDNSPLHDAQYVFNRRQFLTSGRPVKQTQFVSMKPHC